MPKYLTTAQYRTYDAGVLTPEVTDQQLANWIQNAEADIDSYMGFVLQEGGFEQHRAWVQSGWNERTLRTRVLNFPVPVQSVYGYKIQVSNISSAGAGFFAIINPSDVVINVYAGYVEIVPLQAVTYGLAPVLLQLGLKPPLVQLEYQAGFYLPAFGEVLYDNANNQTYTSSRGFWASAYSVALHIQPLQLPPVPPVVYANGLALSSSLYTINYTEGSVTFAVARSSSDVITADYTYTIPDPVKQATVARTTWLLGQRLLAKQGMVGLGQAGMREQRVLRIVHPQFEDLIDSATANKLMPYREIPVG